MAWPPCCSDARLPALANILTPFSDNRPPCAVSGARRAPGERRHDREAGRSFAGTRSRRGMETAGGAGGGLHATRKAGRNWAGGCSWMRDSVKCCERLTDAHHPRWLLRPLAMRAGGVEPPTRLALLHRRHGVLATRLPRGEAPGTRAFLNGGSWHAQTSRPTLCCARQVWSQDSLGRMNLSAYGQCLLPTAPGECPMRIGGVA